MGFEAPNRKAISQFREEGLIGYIIIQPETLITQLFSRGAIGEAVELHDYKVSLAKNCQGLEGLFKVGPVEVAAGRQDAIPEMDRCRRLDLGRSEKESL
jgi:hypothetical protein